MGASRVEVDRANPVLVALSCHDVLTRVEVPDLPRAVVRGRRHNLLPHVECHAANGLGVGVDFSVCIEASWELFILSC